MSARWRRTRLVLAALVLVHVVLAGAAWGTRGSWLPYAIARAPNAGKTASALVRAAPPSGGNKGVRELRIDVGPPRASLAVQVLEPTPPLVSARATVVVLHGIRDSMRSMTGMGRAFTEAGYRAVLVDLRGQGQSTGDWLSFGAREGQDLTQVLDALAAQGLLRLPLGIFGPSYGGAVALQLARRDPRVVAVVTVATFTRMSDVVPLYAERVVPSWMITREDMGRAMERAGVMGEFRPEDSDSVAAIAATQAHVLLLHGRADRHIPWQHSEALHQAAPERSRLLILDGKDHLTIMNDATMTRESVAWFDRWLVAP